MFQNSRKIFMSADKRSEVQSYGSDVKEVEQKLYPSLNKSMLLEKLPPLVLKCLTPVTDNADKFAQRSFDVLLMSVLAFLSSLFGHVRFMYNTRLFSLNIFYVLMSYAGTNKSVAVMAQCIVKGVDRYLQKKSHERLEEWERKNTRWEQERAVAKSEKREPDFSLHPGDKPMHMLLTMPAATSKSQLTLSMKAAEEYGLLLFSTEMTALSDAIGKEYGQFSDLLRKAGTNEPVSQYFKVDGAPVCIDYPMLSICLTGTPDQHQTLFPTTADGLFRRFFHQVGETDTNWHSQKPNEKVENYNDLYEEISEETLQMWLFQQQFEQLTVTFTEAQWERHDAFWSKMLTEFILERGEVDAGIPKSHGFMQMRLASLLTMIRLWEEQREAYATLTFNAAAFPKKVECSDTDFEIAEHITSTLYQHAVALSTAKRTIEVEKAKPTADWRWCDDAMCVMVEKFGEEPFTIADFATVIAEPPFEKSTPTAYRNIAMMRQAKQVKKAAGAKGKYRITKSYLKKLRLKIENKAKNNRTIIN